MKNKNQGQALITLLFFVLFAIIITSGAVLVIINNSLATANLGESARVEQAAQSGIENALLMLLRNPAYSGENMNIDSIQVNTTVNNAGQITITSGATTNSFSRTIQVKANYVNNILTVSGWQEIF